MHPKYTINSSCRKCEWNTGDTEEQEEKLDNKVEIVRKLTYLGDRLSVGGRCGAAVTAKQDVSGISLENVVSHCVEESFL